jgi:quinoprotein glucose dehydrogenase
MQRRHLLAMALTGLLCGTTIVLRSTEGVQETHDWPEYGGHQGTRYSTLTQINRSNVSKLEVAWTYDTGETGGLQTQPIMADGLVYANTPGHRVIALDAGTGRLVWSFDSGITSRGPNRGVTYWTNGSESRVFASVSTFLYALDAKTGEVMKDFGDGGRIDMRMGLGRDNAPLNVTMSSPGVVFRDLIIIGSATAERLPAAPGDIRAYDVRTGEIRWTFRTIPAPGDFGADTWPDNAANARTNSGSANAWAGLTLDAERGIVYVPTGSAAFDFYGGDRLGDNLFANSIIALNAATGERIWHFQTVRHDIWDKDLTAPPTLITVRRNGEEIPGVVQTTKQGTVFVFNRVTGEPLFPIEYRSFPQSEVPGERAADTQPVPVLPRPLVPQTTTEAMLTTRTPEANRWAVETLRTMRTGEFTPLAVGQNTLISPGMDGGVEWGGGAFDPATQRFFVNVSNMPEYTSLVENAPAADGTGRELYRLHCSECHGEKLEGQPPNMPSLVGIANRRSLEEINAVIREGSGPMDGFGHLGQPAIASLLQYITSGAVTPAGGGRRGAPPPQVGPYRFSGYNRFVDPDGYPATAMPWGTLNAIDMNTGEYAWTIPFGEYPELVAQGMKDTGSESYGGPVVTAGGVLFIGATLFDKKFRAYDKDTGQLLWETTLPFAGTATPITYQHNGRQYVVIAAGGRRVQPTGGVYVAFALPEGVK